jgi:hypothetical protein
MRNLVGMSSIKYVLFKKKEKYSAVFLSAVLISSV